MDIYAEIHFIYNFYYLFFIIYIYGREDTA